MLNSMHSKISENKKKKQHIISKEVYMKNTEFQLSSESMEVVQIDEA